MSEEIELKFTLTPPAMRRLSSHPFLAGISAGESVTKRLHSVYFDTETLDLYQADVSLRIRQEGRERIQTIKSKRGDGILMDRDEWDQIVTGNLPDFTAAEGTALAPFVSDKKLRDGIKSRFTVVVDREIIPVVYEGAHIEMALDQGRVSIGRKARRFSELELELKEGPRRALFGLALALAEITTLRPGIKTKAARGYDLIQGVTPAVTKAGSVDIPEGTSTAEAFRKIAHTCLRQLLANEAVLKQERNSGAIHQARVSLRRLRAAISVFRDVLDDNQRTAISGELRWMANRLGDARDLDVYIANVLEPAREAHHGDPAFADLVAHYEASREQAYDSALRAINSRRFTRGIIAALAWIEVGPWSLRDTTKARQRREQPIEEFAARQLERRRNKILKRAKDLVNLPPEERHEVRIALKKLRYSTEFFAAFFQEPGTRKRVKAAISMMTELQDYLGELNDIAVSRERPALSEAEQELRDEHAAHEAELIAKAQKTAEAFTDLDPFWER